MPTDRSVYDFTARAIGGGEQALDEYRGRVLLIVNVASRCGYTPQYAGLEALYTRHRDRGFAVLGFPCNQFGGQEPGSDADILSFCMTTYAVTFPLFSRIDVNGPHAAPLYQFLAHACPGVLGSTAIKWNFTKFLVDREGRPRRRYGSVRTPASLAGDVEALL
jgi:glutathione peroxidase